MASVQLARYIQDIRRQAAQIDPNGQLTDEEKTILNLDQAFRKIMISSSATEFRSGLRFSSGFNFNR